MDINDFSIYSDDLIEKLKNLNHKELILHPMIKTEEVNEKTHNILEQNVLNLCNKLDKLNITVYVENNHVHMQSFYTLEQWENFFNKAPKNTELLIDIVHVLYCDDYDYFKKLCAIKKPKALHIADTVKGKVGKKHLHIPIGKGIIDFEKVFKIIEKFEGIIILEIKNTDKNIIDSRDKIAKILNY